MIMINGGFRGAEDTKKTLFNPNPCPQQLDKDERVERDQAHPSERHLETFPSSSCRACCRLYDPSS